MLYTYSYVPSVSCCRLLENENSLYQDWRSEQLASERITMGMKWPDERSPVHVLESLLSRQLDGTLQVVERVFGQRHHEAGHQSAEQSVDVVLVKVIGCVDGLSDWTDCGHVGRRMRA